MSQNVRGRGRGRQPTYSSCSSPSSVTSSTYVSSSTTPITFDSSTSDTGFSSASSTSPQSIPSSSPIPIGRGRGIYLKRNVVPNDPYWTVTNLTEAQFRSNTRPTKPDDLGTIGTQIQVIANYFPITQFPHQGLVYRHHIQIRNKKNFEIHRDRRR